MSVQPITHNIVTTDQRVMGDTSKHACFYIDTVTFRVDDCLFKLPRAPFETESTAFRDMFLLPTGDLHIEGKDDENPIHLMGITKDEFEQLLSVLFHRQLTEPLACAPPAPLTLTDSDIGRPHGICQISLPETIDQWTSVLKLAGLWGFDTIRRVAIDHLEDRMSAVDKIVLGQTYDLDFESWSLPAMHEIVRRHKPIGVGESRRMGLETTLKLAAVRERVSFQPRFGYSAWEPVAGRRPKVETLDFAQMLRETFKTSN